MGPPNAGIVTRILVISILLVSLIAAFTQRQYGFGVANLNFQVGAVLQGEVWRLITYPFVESSPFGLILSLVILWLFGGSFEARWGERDFLKFFVFATLGAAALAIPLSMFLNIILPFQDMGFSEGPSNAITAMLVALALTNPESNVLLGFVMPVRIRTVVYFWLGYQVIAGIMTGMATLSTLLASMAMGYLLVTGNWRPQRWFAMLRARSGKSARRRGLYVVPPRDKTLH